MSDLEPLPSPPPPARPSPPARPRRRPRTVVGAAALCVLLPLTAVGLAFGAAAAGRHVWLRVNPMVLLNDGLSAGTPTQWLPRVVAVVDGDTIEVDTGKGTQKVRLLGIDTPETKDPRKPVQCFGKEASAHTTELLPPGTPVRLEHDVERRDRYDRLLAYVYRASDGLFVNLELARSGYADTLTYPPNVAHTVELTAAVAEARREQRGLWQACGGFGVPA